MRWKSEPCRSLEGELYRGWEQQVQRHCGGSVSECSSKEDGRGSVKGHRASLYDASLIFLFLLGIHFSVLRQYLVLHCAVMTRHIVVTLWLFNCQNCKPSRVGTILYSLLYPQGLPLCLVGVGTFAEKMNQRPLRCFLMSESHDWVSGFPLFSTLFFSSPRSLSIW